MRMNMSSRNQYLKILQTRYCKTKNKKYGKEARYIENMKRPEHRIRE